MAGALGINKEEAGAAGWMSTESPGRAPTPGWMQVTPGTVMVLP
jgi:hypothetical protein